MSRSPGFSSLVFIVGVSADFRNIDRSSEVQIDRNGILTAQETTVFDLKYLT